MLVCVSLGLLLSPLAIHSSASAHLPRADVSLQQFTFEPSLSVMELTAFAQTAFPATVPPPTPFPTPVMVPIENDEYAVAGDLLIDGRTYPIGDEISSAEDIPLGAVESDPFNDYGYAVIRDQPDYRLLWMTSEDGERHHIIVHKNDPLFAGDDGFSEHVDDLQAGMAGLVTTAAPVATAGAMIVGIGLGLCAPTAGSGCALALGGAVITAVVGIGVEAFFRLGVVDPAIRNIKADFTTIAPNRGIDGDN